MTFNHWHGFCLAGSPEALPPGAQPAETPFAPLVFLTRRDPMRARGWFAITQLAQLWEGEDLSLVTFGSLTGNVLAVADRLQRDGIGAEVIKLNQIIPLPTQEVLHSVQKTGRLLVAQECVSMGSPGEGILAAVAAQGIGLKNTVLCSCGERFIPHGTVSQLRAFCGLDVESLYQKAREVVRYGRKETTGCSAH